MVRGKSAVAPWAAGLSAVCLATALQAQVLTGQAEIIDGDTLRLSGETVRLHAIDAPEAGQRCSDAAGRPWPCGRAATRALRRLARGGLRCEGRARVRYDRLVAKCFAGGRDVAEMLVREGAAFAYPEYGLDYVEAEKAALFAGRGVWSGGATRPSELRTGGAPSEGCVIKGNISDNGRIYHLPGQAHYARTRIAQARGERWFCSEAEARRAGWRRARR